MKNRKVVFTKKCYTQIIVTPLENTKSDSNIYRMYMIKIISFHINTTVQVRIITTEDRKSI